MLVTEQSLEFRSLLSYSTASKNVFLLLMETLPYSLRVYFARDWEDCIPFACGIHPFLGFCPG